MPLTHFPRGVSSFGIPVVGNVPITAGNVYFVDADAGLDGNDGTSFDSPLKTISAAYAKVVSNQDDVIVLSSNGGHSLSAMLTLDKQRVHFVAANFYPRANTQRSRIVFSGNTTVATDVALVKVTGSYQTFQGIKFDANNTNTNQLYGVIVASEGCVFINCSFSNRSLLTTAATADLLEQGTSTRYIDCEMGQDSAITTSRACVLMNAAVGGLAVSTAPEFIDCRFVQWHSADNVFVVITAATDLYGYAIFKRPIFIQKIAEGTGSAQTDVFDPPASITNGKVLLFDPAAMNFTHIASAGGHGNAGIYIIGPVPTTTTSGIVVQAA